MSPVVAYASTTYPSIRGCPFAAAASRAATDGAVPTMRDRTTRSERETLRGGTSIVEAEPRWLYAVENAAAFPTVKMTETQGGSEAGRKAQKSAAWSTSEGSTPS